MDVTMWEKKSLNDGFFFLEHEKQPYVRAQMGNNL
jgi:hypothetical protein